MRIPIGNIDQDTQVGLGGYQAEKDHFETCDVQGQRGSGFRKCPPCGRGFETWTEALVEEYLDNPQTEMARNAVLVKKIWEKELREWRERDLDHWRCSISAHVLGPRSEKELNRIAEKGLQTQANACV